jgi:hypothetical protein
MSRYLALTSNLAGLAVSIVFSMKADLTGNGYTIDGNNFFTVSWSTAFIVFMIWLTVTYFVEEICGAIKSTGGKR